MRTKRIIPKVGDKRIVSGFLWSPLKIVGNHVAEQRWLEPATWEEVCRFSEADSDSVIVWDPTRFLP